MAYSGQTAQNTIAGAATEASNAVTINALRGTITTSTLNVAALGAYVITLTNSSISATSQFNATWRTFSGTLFTNGYPQISWGNPGAGSIVITISSSIPINALAGTLKIDFTII